MRAAAASCSSGETVGETGDGMGEGLSVMLTVPLCPT